METAALLHAVLEAHGPGRQAGALAGGLELVPLVAEL
jgi:hypothetical protein